MTPVNIMWLFPVVFMIHEFEEIIMVPIWFRKHEPALLARFQANGERLLNLYKNLSPSAFSLAVAEEFLLLSLVTWACVVFQFYDLFAGVVIAYGVHLLIHIIQAMIWKGYIPSVITSILTFPYCIAVLILLVRQQLLAPLPVFIASIAGIVIVAGNLYLAHQLAHQFSRWEQKQVA